jgi:hypothetical protein
VRKDSTLPSASRSRQARDEWAGVDEEEEDVEKRGAWADMLAFEEEF